MSPPLLPLVDRWSAHELKQLPDWFAIVPAGRAFLLAGLAAHAEHPILVVVAGEREAEELADDLALFSDRTFHLPAWETLPFEHVSPNVSTMAHRGRAESVLSGGKAGDVVVGSVRAVIQRLSPTRPHPFRVTQGAEAGFDDLVAWLADSGYQGVSRVESRGEFAVRGGIIDVFGAGTAQPVRIEFWGDEVESIREFAVSSQRSMGAVDHVSLHGAREFRTDPDIRARAAELVFEEPWAAHAWDRIAEGVSFPGMESWMPWLAEPDSMLTKAPDRVYLFDPVRCMNRASELIGEERDLAVALAPTWGAGAPEAGDHPSLYLDLSAELSRVEGIVVQAPSLPTGPSDYIVDVSSLDAQPGVAESVAAGLKRLADREIVTVVAMDGAAAADRVARILGEEGFALPRLDVLEKPTAAITSIGIHQGFVMSGPGVAVVGEQQIAGRRRAHRRTTARAGQGSGPGYRDLADGDFVVHHRHGIGRFEGLVTRTISGVERDYLIIAYAGADKLYVPTDSLAAVRKYTGGEAPRVSRMGGADWEKTKGKVRKAVAAIAEKVVDLHRRRAAAVGYAFGPDTPWEQELENSFPFEETPDQLTAIGDVKQDMAEGKPMDRLIFGDVGFGKTEVAIRAVFKAAVSGKQAAVLCPTTLLAQQHFQTFSDRFDPYPIRVEVLSRFLTAAQQRVVLAGVEAGDVEVVIGTHRLLSQDVNFKNLGLMVVDEEQRFGVGAKDRLKEMKVGVDVLTLTATPIPRTLEMALTGVRDVSHIRTPPEDRHPILTYVGPYDRMSVSAAIRREMLREGQVFYVHNRVQSIDRAVAQLRSLVPDARYAIAHGQMSEGQLEQVMLDFWNREYDVLVATTIIESGLDLPQVNTLIVERADLLGLAQLYQLRGRVGRSDQRAYAYLFHPTDQIMSEDAHRRLEAIGEHSDLGSGFDVALRDLEIRGAGSMLGEVQSGHISAVGFDTYVNLVAEAVGELEGFKSETTDDPPEVRIDLPVDAHLPDEYIADQAARIEAYRRLAATLTSDQVSDVAAEWTDRYGELPPSGDSLIGLARLRTEAIRVGLTEIVKLRNEIRIGPVDLSDSQEIRLKRLAPKSVLRAGEGSVFLPAPPDAKVVEHLIGFIQAMWA